MKTDHLLVAFSALSQETRLKVFKMLVEHGKKGAPAGALSESLKIPHNTLSFHLSLLSQAELVTSRKEGRSIIYVANTDTVQDVVQFLLKDCCAIDKSNYKAIKKLLKKA